MKSKSTLVFIFLICLCAITVAQSTSQQVIAYQYYFDTDPGMGVTGNGAIVNVGSVAIFNSTISVPVPGTLSQGLHNLYLRMKDNNGNWSIAERRNIIVEQLSTNMNVNGYQYFFDSDPGEGVSGNGAIVNIGSTSNFNNTIAIPVSTLSNGLHNLYIRMHDSNGDWSIAERRSIIIEPLSLNMTVTAYQYYFDNDPGVGVAGNGAVVGITAASNFNNQVGIAVPASLGGGMHILFLRMRDSNGEWGISERRLFIIQANTQNITALEYYFDNDPGTGNGNPFPITATANFNSTIQLNVACLSTGQHFVYVRAKSNSSTWSIIERDTIQITGGITSSNISPAGTFSICYYDSLLLSATYTSGIIYQWLLNGNPISGANNFNYMVHAGGNYSLKMTCGNSFTTSNIITVNIMQPPAIVTNPVSQTRCIGQPVTFSVNATGDGLTYQWRKNGSNISGAVFPAFTISNVQRSDSGYFDVVINGTCTPAVYSDTVRLTVPVNANAGTILGSPPLCIGSTVSFSSNGDINGSWSSSNNFVANVNSAGIVTAQHSGNANIIYTVNSGCNSPVSSSYNVTVNPNANAGNISGDTLVCINDTILLMTDGDGSGTWSSINQSTAIVNATTGKVTGLVPGIANIIYTVNTGCNAPASSSKIVYVSPDVNAGIINGLTSLCIGQTSLYTSNGNANGIWSSDNLSVATIIPATGMATATGGGTAIISYGIYTGCHNPTVSTISINVNAIIFGNSGQITGQSHLCIGGSGSYSSDGDAGGVWTSDDASIAIVNSSTGIVTAMAPGTVHITYTVTGCHGLVSSQKTITVDSNVFAGSIAGSSTLCVGSAVGYISNGTPGGNWSSSNSAIANAASSSGIISAISTGTAVITYTVTGCGGTAFSTKSISTGQSVNAGLITGNSLLCLGGIQTLNVSGTPGGIWSSSNSSVASINNITGQITGLSPGIVSVTYSVSGCNGTFTSAKSISVIGVASAGNITGPSALCVGASGFFSTDGTPGGTWISSNQTVALINSSNGFVSAFHFGTTVITYTISACTGTFSSTMLLTVGPPATAGNITGNATFCIGDTQTFVSNGSAGGLWSSSNPVVAGVNGSSGIITALSSGSATIKYTVNGCNGVQSASQVISVTSFVSPGTISGPSSLCIGSGATFSTSGSFGGTWSSSNPLVATIGASTGVVNALTAGNSTINYLLSGCGGTFLTSHILNVAGTPPVFSFSGTPNFSSSVVFPSAGEPSDAFRFEIKYSDADGQFPAPGFPKLALDFEGDGILNGPRDRNLFMTQADPSDQNVIDGKIYFVVLHGLGLSTNWKATFIAKSSGGCDVLSGAFDGPDVSTKPNLSIFANDISFSTNHPAVSSLVTVFAIIHNDTAVDVENVRVHLINQYNFNQLFPDTIVPVIHAYSSVPVSWTFTTPNNPSWLPMQVIVDYNNTIDESNELDNQAIRPIVNGNFVVAGNILVTAGGPATVCESVSNAICGNASYHNTAVILPDPSVAGATVTATIPETGQQFSAYTNSHGDYCITFQSPPITGIYSVKLSVTDFTITGEDSLQFTVTNCPPPSGPDLVSQVLLNNSQVFSGSPITGKVKIINMGNQTAAASAASVYLQNATSVSQQYLVPSLAPGLSFTTSQFSLISPLDEGIEKVISDADINNSVAELHEDNNSNSSDIRICPLLPDLIGIYPGAVYPPSPIFLCDDSIHFFIQDIKCVSVVSPFDVSLQIFKNGMLVNNFVKTVSSSIMGDDGTGISFRNPFTTSGNYNAVFSVDAGHAITEIDETNNILSTPFTVLDCKPDLFVYTECSAVSPPDPAIPGNITVHATLSNLGRGIASAPFVADFLVGGNHYPVTITSDIAKGASIPLTRTFPTPPFTCPELNITVDPSNAIDEIDENNNSASIQLNYDFLLDRICYDPVLDGSDPNPNFWEGPHNFGEAVILGIGVWSYSTYTASSLLTRFEVSGPQIIGWLDLGTVASPDFRQSCSECPSKVILPNGFVFPDTGTYHVRISTDAYNQYIECDENNNDTILDVVITNAADYRTLSQYIAPSLLNPERGQPISIDVSYQNIGTDGVNDSLDILVKVDNLPHETIRVKTLLSGTRFTAHCNNQWSSMTPGLHIIRAIVDSQNEISESDESNNEATRSFVVGKAANLYFQAFYPDISSPNLSQQILINARIGNSGDLECKADVQFFYLNNLHDSVPIGIIHVDVDGRDSVNYVLPWSVLDNTTLLIGKIVNATVIQFRQDDKIATTRLKDFDISIASIPGCLGGNDGYLKVNISGGIPPYSILWSTLATTDSLSAPSGNYSVTVTDQRGSTRAATGRIYSLPAPSFYEDADGDGYGNPFSIIEDCVLPLGYVTNNLDCNDGNANIHPGVIEICNGIDDNCDGQIDEGVLLTFYRDEDGDGYGSSGFIQACAPPAGYVSNNQDCNDSKATVHPGAIEICDGLDNNCNGQIDEGVMTIYYRDQDGDGYGNPNAITLNCSPPPGYVSDNTDCNDANALVNPGAIERCNGIDDNCNGLIDEGCIVVLHLRAFIEGFYLGNGQMAATVDPVNYPNLCDTIRLELRKASGPYNVIYRDTGTIDIYGNATLNFPPEIFGQQYYIAIHHRNAIETWSASPVFFSSFVMNYSFTNAITKAYGNNLRDLGDGNFAMWSGDISDALLGVGHQDGVVESQDYSDMENAVYLTLIGYMTEDITGDGVVESGDYSIEENNVYYIIHSMHP